MTKIYVMQVQLKGWNQPEYRLYTTSREAIQSFNEYKQYQGRAKNKNYFGYGTVKKLKLKTVTF